MTPIKSDIEEDIPEELGEDGYTPLNISSPFEITETTPS